MTPQELERFQTAADGAGVLFYFKGEITAPGIAALGDTLRRRLDELEVRGTPGRKLFSSFVEMAQNVLHYAWDETGERAGDRTRRGTIAIGTGDDHHWIASCNEVGADDVPRLRERIERIARMTPDELREAYRRQLDDDTHEAQEPLSRGAGLGLLTIARAARSPLEHAFVRIPESGGTLARFHLCARLDRLAPRKEDR